MPSLYANIVSSNAVIQPNNNTSLYNPLGGNTIPVNGNINANNVNVSNNVNVGGQISAVGNITTAGFLFGNGSQLTGITSSYGNANVAVFLPTYTGNLAGNNIALTGAAVVTGNITSGGFYFGDGSQLTNLPASNYSNANVAAFLPTYSGNISAGNIDVALAITGATVAVSSTISATGDISTAGNLRTLGAQGNIVGANYVSAGYFVGDGSLLTNVVATTSYSNANVVSLLAAFGSNTVSTTGNISSGYLFGNGSQLTGIAASGYGNAQVATFLSSFGSNTISSTGNITTTANIAGNYILGNGSQLTDLPIQPGTYSNANVQAYLPTYNGNIGNINGAPLELNADQVHIHASNTTGTVNGISLNTPNGGSFVAMETPKVYIAEPQGGGGTQLVVAGNITTQPGDVIVGGLITATGNITGNYFIGNGSQLTGLPAGYSNADVNSHLAAFGANTISTTGNVTAGYFVGNGSLLTDLTGANVTGQVANALVAGTVYTNAQPNITSVGTLTSLSVTGNVTSGNVNTNAVQATGSGGLALKNSAGTTQASLGAGGGDNFAINVSTNLNGNNAQIDISPTGTGHVHIKPTGTGAVEIAPTNTGSINNMIIGNVTPRAANVTTLGTTGNIAAAGILTDNYYYANGTPFTGGGGTYGNANVNTLLAAWGSNSLSTTGNVTSTNAVTTNILMTGSISNPVGDNIAIENITTGLISATGNITGAYIKGNISEATGGYGNSNVATFLGAFGSNSIVTTGNIGNLTSKLGYGFINNLVTDTISSDTGDFVTIENVSTTVVNASGNINASNLNLTGQIYDSTGVLQLNGSGNIVLVPTGTTVASGNLSATGNITGSYFLGNGSALTGVSATAGGSNTQIQFNDGTAFAGNSNMTFDKTTGTIILGNLAVSGLRVLPNNSGTLTESDITATGTAYQMRVGNNFNGSLSWSNVVFAPGSAAATGPGARLLQSDTWTLGNSGSRLSGFVTQNFVTLTANITNNNSRFQGGGAFLAVGGGASANTMTLTNDVLGIQAFGSGITIGNSNPNLASGNTSIAYVNGQATTLTVAAGSTVNYLTGFCPVINTVASANVANMVAYHARWSSTAGNAVNNYAVYYNAGNTASTTILPPVTTGTIARGATAYHAFRNDDDLAMSRLGSLERMHYATANVTSSGGAITIDKNNGQSQQIFPTENVTSVTFSNFVTRVAKPSGTQMNQTDFVTFFVQQGATPYNITLPTGNSQIRYANGVSTVTGVANTTVQINITGVFNYNANANNYLVTVNPAFT